MDAQEIIDCCDSPDLEVKNKLTGESIPFFIEDIKLEFRRQKNE